MYSRVSLDNIATAKTLVYPTLHTLRENNVLQLLWFLIFLFSAGSRENLSDFMCVCERYMAFSSEKKFYWEAVKRY